MLNEKSKVITKTNGKESAKEDIETPASNRKFSEMTNEKMNHRRDKEPNTKKRQEAKFQVEVILAPVPDAQDRLARAFALVLRMAAAQIANKQDHKGN